MLAQWLFKANDFKSALEVVEDEFLKIKILLQDDQNDVAYEMLEKIPYSKLQDAGKKNFYILKAQYNYNKGLYQEALEEIENYLIISKPDAVSFQIKALIYEELKDDFSAYLNWAFCKKLMGKIDEAIVEFENAYKVNPKDKTVLVELAQLYEKNKERFVSIEYWERVYALDNDKQAQEILAEF